MVIIVRRGGLFFRVATRLGIDGGVLLVVEEVG